MIGAGEGEFQTAVLEPTASSSRLEEEDDDVAGSVEPAMSTQNSIFPRVFSILIPFQPGSHEELYGSRK